MTKEEIKDVINNSYRSTSEGYLIDVDWAATKLEAFFSDKIKESKAEVEKYKSNLFHSERFRAEDAVSAINEANFLRNQLSQAEADKQELLDSFCKYCDNRQITPKRFEWKDVIKDFIEGK